LIGILVLLVRLVQKELSSAAAGTRFEALSKALNIGIVPLMIAFVMVVVARVAEVLR
jgi:hypothetical protein